MIRLPPAYALPYSYDGVRWSAPRLGDRAGHRTWRVPLSRVLRPAEMTGALTAALALTGPGRNARPRVPGRPPVTVSSPRVLTALGTSPLRFFLLHPHGSPLYPPSAPMIDSCAPRKRSHWYSRWPPCGWVRFWCCFPGFLEGGRGARSGKQNGRLTIGRTRYHERGGWRTTGAFPAAGGRESRRTAPALCWLSASVLNPE